MNIDSLQPKAGPSLAGKSQSDLIGSAVVGLFIGVVFVTIARFLLRGFIFEGIPNIYFLFFVGAIPALSLFGMV